MSRTIPLLANVKSRPAFFVSGEGLPRARAPAIKRITRAHEDVGAGARGVACTRRARIQTKKVDAALADQNNPAPSPTARMNAVLHCSGPDVVEQVSARARSSVG